MASLRSSPHGLRSRGSRCGVENTGRGAKNLDLSLGFATSCDQGQVPRLLPRFLQLYMKELGWMTSKASPVLTLEAETEGNDRFHGK